LIFVNLYQLRQLSLIWVNFVNFRQLCQPSSIWVKSFNLKRTFLKKATTLTINLGTGKFSKWPLSSQGRKK